jgi:hypothetical protein
VLLACHQLKYVVFRYVPSHAPGFLCIGDISGLKWLYCMHGPPVAPKCASNKFADRQFRNFYIIVLCITKIPPPPNLQNILIICCLIFQFHIHRDLKVAKLSSWSWALLQFCSYSRTSQHFMEPEGSVPCS